MKLLRAPFCCGECLHCVHAGLRGSGGPTSPTRLLPPGPTGGRERAEASLRCQHPPPLSCRHTGSTAALFSALPAWQSASNVGVGRGIIAEDSGDRTTAYAVELSLPFSRAQPLRCCAADAWTGSTSPVRTVPLNAPRGRPWSSPPLTSTAATSTCPRASRPRPLRPVPSRGATVRNEALAAAMPMARLWTPGRRMAGSRSRLWLWPGTRGAKGLVVGCTPWLCNPCCVMRSPGPVGGRHQRLGARAGGGGRVPSPLSVLRPVAIAHARPRACAPAGRGPPLLLWARPPRPFFSGCRRRRRACSVLLMLLRFLTTPLRVGAAPGWLLWAFVPVSVRVGCG